MKLLLAILSTSLYAKTLTDDGPKARFESELDKFTQNKKDASKVLKSVGIAQGKTFKLDPDTWCNQMLTAPSCWEEFSETVWQPFRFNNMVSKQEGKPLARCVDKCSWGDWFKDFVGTAYEENRETREEYQDSIGLGDRKVVTGCAQCCDKIPRSVRCLKKVQKSCPDLDYSHCGGVFRSPSNE